MKIKPEHLSVMREAIKPLAEKLSAHRAFIVAEGKAQDVEKRLRWDACYAAKLTPFLCKEVYGYADDTHIDTALRSIMAEILHA